MGARTRSSTRPCPYRASQAASVGRNRRCAGSGARCHRHRRSARPPREFPGTERDSVPGSCADDPGGSFSHRGVSRQDVFDAPGIPRGVAWGELGIVVASDTPQGGALFAVSSPGAQPRKILERTGARLSQPTLVDRGAVAYLSTDEKQDSQVCAMDETGAERGCVALAALSIGYSATGHLLFSRGPTLFAQRFDSQRVAFGGDPFVLTNDVAGTARQYWAVSSAGSAPLLAYLPASGRGDSQFVWFDRAGLRLGPVGEPAVYASGFDLSANEASIVAGRSEAAGNAPFLIDVVRGAATRVPGPRQVGDLVWAPDGRRFAFAAGTQVTEQAAFGGAGRVVFQDPQLAGVED